MERLAQIARCTARWFTDSATPYELPQVDRELHDAGLISLEIDGWIYLTPAGLDALYLKQPKKD